MAFSEGCPAGGDGNKYRLREFARGELSERRAEGVAGLPHQRRSACSKEGYLGFDDDAPRRIEPLHVWFQPRAASEFEAGFIAGCWGVQPASLDEIRVRGSLIRAVIECVGVVVVTVSRFVGFPCSRSVCAPWWVVESRELTAPDVSAFGVRVVGEIHSGCELGREECEEERCRGEGQHCAGRWGGEVEAGFRRHVGKSGVGDSG